MFVQRPGVKTGKKSFGSGWDIILPAGWGKCLSIFFWGEALIAACLSLFEGMPFWVNLIYNGARACGYRDSDHVAMELNHLPLVVRDPDSVAGKSEIEKSTTQVKLEYFAKPPDKRPQYIKLKTPAPFGPR